MTKKIEQPDNSNGKYGFISMAAMIIGIVVASGIFVKNSEIITGTNSAILTTIAWIVGGLIVLCMMMGFLEITSSSRLKKEQGTILNWSRNFLGMNASRIIGFYITFLYIPLLTIGLSFFAANFLFQGIGVDFSLIWGFIFITFFGIFFMVFAQVVNGLTTKPGKIFQTVGTFIKLIPLFAIIIIAIAAIVGSINTVDPNAVFNPDDDINAGLGDGVGHSVALIFAVLPGILFSFDGFLYADSLSLEAKKETTYKKALIFSIIFIIIIYIIFSLSTMALAKTNEDGSFANDAFNTTIIFGNVFPNHSAISTTLVMLIMISVLVAVNGLSTVSSRNLADASHQNLIEDKNGVLLRRNHSEAPYNAAFKVFIFMLIFAVILRVGDAIMIDWTKNPESYIATSELKVGGDLQLTGIATNLACVFMFFMYGLILIGGVVNRFTKKIEVQKSFGFIFFAIIAMIFMIASSGYFLWDIFLQDIVWLASGIPSDVDATIKSTSKELIGIVFFLTILISMWIAISVYNRNHIKDVNFANYPNKINARKTYDALISYKDYEKAVFSKSTFSTLVNHPEKLNYDWYLKQQELLDEKIIHEKEALKIRSFLPLKFQEKLNKDKKEKKQKNLINEDEKIVLSSTLLPKKKAKTSEVQKENDVVKTENLKKESVIKKFQVTRIEIKKLTPAEKKSHKAQLLKIKDKKLAQKEVLKVEKLKHKADLEQTKKAFKEKQIILQQKKAKQKIEIKAKAKAKKKEAKEAILIAKQEAIKAETVEKAKKAAKIAKLKAKGIIKIEKEKDLALALATKKDLQAQVVKHKEEKEKAILAKKLAAKEAIINLELEKSQILTKEIEEFKIEEINREKLIAQKKEEKLIKKEQIINETKKAEEAAFIIEQKELKDQAKIDAIKEKQLIKKEKAKQKKILQSEKNKAKKIAILEKQKHQKEEIARKQQVKENREHQIELAKEKAKNLQEKVATVAKEDLVKVQDKTKEIKKIVKEEIVHSENVLLRKDKDNKAKKSDSLKENREHQIDLVKEKAKNLQEKVATIAKEDLVKVQDKTKEIKKIVEEEIVHSENVLLRKDKDNKAKKLDSLKENREHQIDLVKEKAKNLQEKVATVAKEDLVKVQDKTKEIKKIVEEEIVHSENVLLRKDKNEKSGSIKEGEILNKLNFLKAEKLEVDEKAELENLKSSQYNEEIKIAKNSKEKAKNSIALKIEKSKIKKHEAREIYKKNKEILKEAKLAEKEASQAEKAKIKADLDLQKLKIEKGFNELKNNLLAEGIKFNFKSSKTELQQIAQEYNSLSDDQLNSQLLDYEIEVNNLKTKAQKYNLIKEFEKITIDKIKAHLIFSKINYEKNLSKGKLFSLWKNN